MRVLSESLPHNVPIVPCQPSWVVDDKTRSLSASEAAWQTTSAANYVARVGLKGHYLEFGTFWGASFFPNYFRLRHWLDGKFFAFDSFAGLSQPELLETKYSSGDFYRGAYRASEETFRLIGDSVEVDWSRICVVPGFFEVSVSEQSLRNLGILEQSISVLYIDCDLLGPTAHVLEVCEPFLEDGALIYFDDWRLCRASSQIGERAAALSWLAKHPRIELVEFDRTFWQHQWFIFTRT